LVSKPNCASYYLCILGEAPQLLSAWISSLVRWQYKSVKSHITMKIIYTIGRPIRL
jgi:hypothetical protein